MTTVSTASSEIYKYSTSKTTYEQVSHEPTEPYTYNAPHTVWPLSCEQNLEHAVLDFESITSILYNITALQKSSAISTGIENLFNLLVSTKISIPEPAEVRNYLLVYPDMINILLPVFNKITEKFNTSAQISLEVYEDPEINDKYLTAYIRQETYNENIMDLIDEISSECESLLANSTGWLLITTDFQSPIK
ncbi:MAG: hypothetical protein ACPL28_02490 [bacterium]